MAFYNSDTWFHSLISRGKCRPSQLVPPVVDCPETAACPDFNSFKYNLSTVVRQDMAREFSHFFP
ncbi:hypothetical protein F220043C3_54930 [Enterocloster asparagiformis]